MRVLLMSVHAGYGHHSAANAVIEEFEYRGHTCKMLDIFDYISHPLGVSIQNGYLLLTKYMSDAYGKVYGKLSKNTEPYNKHSIYSMLNNLVTKKLENFVSEFNPDVIIGTHSYCGIVMTRLKRKNIINCMTIGIVTDFTVHPFWESTGLDYYVIADKLLEHQMNIRGIDSKKLLCTGIPIKYSKKYSKKDARSMLGISDKTTILIMMGSMGYGNIKKVICELDRIKKDFQILCVCGTNKKAKESIDEYKWEKDIYAFEFVSNINIMMDASDIIITKPGGMTTSEALAKKLPMIVINPLPGHEDRNLFFLINNGAAIAVNETYSVSEAVYSLLSSDWRRELMEESISKIGKPNAAHDLYDFIVQTVAAQ